MHSKKRNTIEANVLENAVAAAREQVIHIQEEPLNSSLNNGSIMSIDTDEQMAIPKPNYDAQKPEEVFVLGESACDRRSLVHTCTSSLL